MTEFVDLNAMFDVILYQPEIPPNTGNIIRLCANAGARLHLVEPLGFDLSDKQLARAGMDYTELSVVTRHANWAACLAALPGRRFFALSTRGKLRFDAPKFGPGDAFIFGAESAGLPPEILEGLPPEQRLRLPMRPGNRSLNLSNTVAILVYEAWRQQDFVGGA